MDSIHLPNAIALPNAFGAPGTPLPPGQVMQALVLALIESDIFRLQLPQAVVDVRSDVRLTPGTTITLAAKGTGANTRFVIYSDAPGTASAGQGGAPSLAGRRPIGEAVIVARTPAQGAAPAQGRGAQPAVLRDAPSMGPTQVPARTPGVPAPGVSPQQAVGEAVRVAASRQSGLAPLFADVEQAVQLSNVVPAPARAAARELLGLRIPLDAHITANDVKQAFVRSGVLFETKLAAAKDSPAAKAETSVPAPASDLKAALLVLRQVLKAWSASEPAPSRTVTTAVALTGSPEEAMPGGALLSPEQATTLARTVATALSPRDAPSAPAVSQSGPPPPYRGAPLAAQAAAPPSIAPDAPPHEIADKLIAQADGALARQTLLQVASLPDQPDLPRVEASQRWTFEIPFATPQATSIAQFEVSRDACAPNSDPHARIWRARFSLDAEPMGRVHALIALAGSRASVTLWAERAMTASRLQDSAPLLSEALRAADLEPADVQLRVGAPPAMRQAAPGRFMDRAT